MWEDEEEGGTQESIDPQRESSLLTTGRPDKIAEMSQKRECLFARFTAPVAENTGQPQPAGVRRTESAGNRSHGPALRILRLPLELWKST